MLKLILQPIVENAIAHGIKNREEPGFIYIRSSSKDNFLEFVIRDNGPGVKPEVLGNLNHNTYLSSGKNGFGIKNVYERLSLYYCNDFALRFAAVETGGVEVTIRVPLIPGQKDLI